MDCWTLLGLTADADERSIKRSYARRLKSTRPDEDAEGFQRLREAYERALQLARWRADEAAAEDDAPVVISAPLTATQPPDNLQHWSSLLELHPLIVEPLADWTPEPLPELAPAPPQPDPWPLLEGLNAENLPQRWQQAEQQACDREFLKHLLARCYEQPEQHMAMILWAIQHLDWLTPWQRPCMTVLQEAVLVQAVLQEYRRTLEAHLEAGQERAFLTQLANYCEQPWLRIFDHRQYWQNEVLELLHEQRWQLPLFDRVCQLFGWDDRRGATPEPSWIWQSLIERCQQEAFYQKLLANAAKTHDATPEVAAARLLLNPQPCRRQIALTRHFEDEHWLACMELSQTLASRFPALLERLPRADVFFWQELMPRPLGVDNWIRCGVGSSLALGLYFMGKPEYSKEMALILAMGCAGVLAIFALILLNTWEPVAARLLALDLWLSERLVPKRLNPQQQWLVLRHGVPQVAILSVFGYWLGALGMLAYLGFALIGVLHSGRIGQPNPDFCARHPWLGALHWNHFSPWQPAYLLLMVVLIRVCQVHAPGFPLTRLFPG